MMKNWITKNFMKLWISGLAGMGFGFIVELTAGWLGLEGSVNSYLMIGLIIGGAVAAWYILTNNKNFGKF